MRDEPKAYLLRRLSRSIPILKERYLDRIQYCSGDHLSQTFRVVYEIFVTVKRKPFKPATGHLGKYVLPVNPIFGPVRVTMVPLIHNRGLCCSKPGGLLKYISVRGWG